MGQSRDFSQEGVRVLLPRIVEAFDVTSISQKIVLSKLVGQITAQGAGRM